VANVCNMSRTVAIEVYLKFEKNSSFSFPLVTAKINRRLLNNRLYGAKCSVGKFQLQPALMAMQTEFAA
jgi:hypothetical protein